MEPRCIITQEHGIVTVIWPSILESESIMIMTRTKSTRFSSPNSAGEGKETCSLNAGEWNLGWMDRSWIDHLPLFLSVLSVQFHSIQTPKRFVTTSAKRRWAQLETFELPPLSTDRNNASLSAPPKSEGDGKAGRKEPVIGRDLRNLQKLLW